MASPLQLDALRLTPSLGIAKIAAISSLLSDVIGHLQNFSTALPRIDFVTNTETRKFYVGLPGWGVTLVFDERYQMLELILVDVTGTRMNVYLNRAIIRSVDDFRREVREAKGKKAGKSVVVEAGEGVTAVVRDGELDKLVIHSGSDCFHLTGETGEQVSVVELEPGVQLSVFPPKQVPPSHLPFGSPPESVIDLFGLPSKVVYHSTLTNSQSTDYVYNYFAAGLDFVFDGLRHELKEAVARNNLPEDCFFGVYHRCQFRVVLGEGKVIDVLSDLSHVQSVLGPSAQLSRQPSEHNFEPITVCSLPGLSISLLSSGLIASVHIWRP